MIVGAVNTALTIYYRIFHQKKRSDYSPVEYWYIIVWNNLEENNNMFLASVLSHVALGFLFALIFVLYYVNADGKWKVYLEMLIGIGGNTSGIFVLDRLFNIEDKATRMYSISACIFAFLVLTGLLLVLLSYVIKDKNNKDIIRLRDILLGQTSWINKYYEMRAKEIDEKLNIPTLKKRENEIRKIESELASKEIYLNEEQERIQSLGRKNLKFILPEKANITITKDFIDAMPSYINDIFRCINDMNSCTQLFLSNPVETIDLTSLKSYLGYIATYISRDIFGGKSTDVRIHFRYYNKGENAYDKLVAIIGENIVTKKMTLIPYDDDTMIKKSYECKRALIKSINTGHDYQGNNYTVWQDYMTYTFYNLKTEEKPYLSFGISVKNEARYKKLFYFLNYFKLEVYLQENIELVNEYVNIEHIIYGG